MVRIRSGLAAVAAAVGLGALPGCAESSRPAEAPVVPEGSRLVRCMLFEQDGDTTGTLVTFALPRTYRPLYREGHDRCAFGHRRFYSEVRVETATESLAAERRDELDPWVGTEGDEAVYETEYADGVPMFGASTGETLDYRFANDGLPTYARVAQADEIRVRWEVPDGRRRLSARGMPVVLETLRIEPDAEAQPGDTDYEPDM